MDAIDRSVKTSRTARRGELEALPSRSVPVLGRPSGIIEVGLLGGKAALVYVPAALSGRQNVPLLLMLHGAGGSPRHSIELARYHADRLGFILVAPPSRASTWDIISARRYGDDVIAIDNLLKRIFEEHAIDSNRIAIGGFSDGASYALSLGLTNGELFRHVIAFSPGFISPGRSKGAPAIFISHGIQDSVLPIDVCSRRLVPQLRGLAYKVDYREFDGGHIAPDNLVQAAFDTFAASRGESRE